MFVLFLHGPPAVGKHTVGAKVAERLGLPLFHNHRTVDLALGLFPFGSPGFVALRERTWLTAFELAAREGRSFVFTFHPEATVSPTLVDRLVAVVAAAGGEVLFFELRASEGTIEDRLGAPSRKSFGKLTDVAFYRRLSASGAFEFPPLPPPLLVVDTETSPPEAAAAAIEGALVTRFPAWFAPPKSPPVSTG